MTKAIQIWKRISKDLADHVPVMLLYVLESKGSSPGRQGFFMSVNATGVMEGSVGGGMMEHKFVEMAKKELGVKSSELGLSAVAFAEAEVRKQVHDKSAAKDQSGMICSGEQTIWLYPVKKSDGPVIDRLIASLEKNKMGTIRLSPEGIFFTDNIPEKDFRFEMRADDDWEYIEKTGYKNELFIIGGGHCALALSRLMRSMDFYIRVYDERKELKTMLENDFAHEKIFVNDYTELKEIIPSGRQHFVVIMTFGYRSDDIALRSLLDKEFYYLGVLGSEAKMKKLFEAYKEEGVSETKLQHVHTPIGISIRSQTPEEIAVSIAAEIIREKNRSLP